VALRLLTTNEAIPDRPLVAMCRCERPFPFKDSGDPPSCAKCGRWLPCAVAAAVVTAASAADPCDPSGAPASDNRTPVCDAPPELEGTEPTDWPVIALDGLEDLPELSFADLPDPSSEAAV
jgi:hypothetical protein